MAESYASTSDYDDNQIEEFYDQLQNVIDQTPKKDILVEQGDGMQKWARLLMTTGKAFVDPSAMTKQMRGDSDSSSKLPLTILCWRTLLVITKHPEDGHGIALMDNTTSRLITF